MVHPNNNSLAPQFDVGSHTVPGNRYGSLNQDHVVTCSLAASGKQLTPLQIGAVLDGHGLLGEQAAKRAGQELVRRLRTSSLQHKPLEDHACAELQKLMQELFDRAHQEAMAVYNDPPKSLSYPRNGSGPATYTLHTVDGRYLYRSLKHGVERWLECGTTCTLGLLQGRTLCIANVGDSAAVLGFETNDGDYMSQLLTVHHCGLNESEAERIRCCHQLHARLQPRDGYLAITSGHLAGYELSVTRALGHKFLNSHGVITRPDVSLTTLEDRHCCLIMATDGLWDVMSGDEAVRQVMDAAADGLSAQQAAQQLVCQADELAACSPGGDADNTSAVVVYLNL